MKEVVSILRAHDDGGRQVTEHEVRAKINCAPQISNSERLVACNAGACSSRARGSRSRRSLRVPIVLFSSVASQRQLSQHGCASKHGIVSSVSMSQRVGPGNTRKRGHQHHPRNNGSRRRAALEPTIVNTNTVSEAVALTKHSVPQQFLGASDLTPPAPVILSASSATTSDVSSNQTEALSKADQVKSDIIDLTNCDDEVVNSKQDVNPEVSKLEVVIKPSRKNGSYGDMSLVVRPAAEGSSQSDQEAEDAEVEELARLRCTSERTEVVAERETRRKNRRCADYPGLAFGSSIFSSDTLMKFSIIRNELHNITNTQLKRAESEIAALNRRIQLLEEDLERSEERLATATAKLAEASQAADESERIRKALENRTNMEDDRVAILESQLSQAKLIAEEADKKYEEVARKLVLMEQDLERAEERAENSESKIVELEEELRVVGNNLKSLEVSEEKATIREENYASHVKTLDGALKEAEARAEFAERSVQKLQKEVDKLEDDLLAEKEKNKLLADEMEATLHDIQNM